MSSRHPTSNVRETTSLVRHDISKKHDVAGIYAHAMGRHGVLNLINDGSSRRFNPKHLGHFRDVIRRRVFTHNA
jgi:hypothetical protein